MIVFEFARSNLPWADDEGPLQAPCCRQEVLQLVEIWITRGHEEGGFRRDTPRKQGFPVRGRYLLGWMLSADSEAVDPGGLAIMERFADAP